MTLSNGTTKEDIYPMMVDMLHEMFGLDKSTITLDADLYRDLDIDSIDAVDLAVKLKEVTGKRLQPEVFKSVRTVQDVVNALTALLEK
jgi:acyl carrier protein